MAAKNIINVISVLTIWYELGVRHYGQSTGMESANQGKVPGQETPGVTGKFVLGIQNEAGKRLIEFCQENALVIENTLFQQHKRRLYTWTSPDGQH